MKRRWAVIAVICLAFVAVCAIGAGEFLTTPAQRAIGAPPADLSAEQVILDTAARGNVAGWFVQGKPGLGAVLLLHSVRSDRREMIARARFLHDLGYAILLIDLPAHGESPGPRITFGLREARGVEAALAYLGRRLPGERVAAIGVSMGGAAIALARLPYPPSAI